MKFALVYLPTIPAYELPEHTGEIKEVNLLRNVRVQLLTGLVRCSVIGQTTHTSNVYNKKLI